MIYVECLPDTTLAKSLSGGMTVEHLHGKSRVCNKLMDNTNSKGMVDQDEKTQTHPYIKELIATGTINDLQNDEIIVYIDIIRHNTLVMLKPRLEEWIIKTTRIAGINMMNSYHLPDTAEELHLALSIGDKEHINKFRMLIQKLANNSERVDTLARLLR